VDISERDHRAPGDVTQLWPVLPNEGRGQLWEQGVWQVEVDGAALTPGAQLAWPGREHLSAGGVLRVGPRGRGNELGLPHGCGGQLRQTLPGLARDQPVVGSSPWGEIGAAFQERLLYSHHAGLGLHIHVHDVGNGRHRLLGLERIARELNAQPLARIGLLGEGGPGWLRLHGLQAVGAVVGGALRLGSIVRDRLRCLGLLHRLSPHTGHAECLEGHRLAVAGHREAPRLLVCPSRGGGVDADHSIHGTRVQSQRVQARLRLLPLGWRAKLTHRCAEGPKATHADHEAKHTSIHERSSS
jgi:hypothetical protein